MSTNIVRVQSAAVLIGLIVAGCTAVSTAEPSPSANAVSTPSATATPRPTPWAIGTATVFPVTEFAGITEEPVPASLAAELQAILEENVGVAGVSAVLMSAHGTWSGVSGVADGVREVTVKDQFSIASTTKAITAAQVMQLVEAGQIGLDDRVADHLPPDLVFDTNGATIRNLLGHRSGIPDYIPQYTADPLRFWTAAELLAAVPADRKPAGGESEYANSNYLLLGLAIEHVTGRPMVEVLRAGVLDIDGVERLIYQPDEVPTQPIAIDNGRSTEFLEAMGGFLPSLALTSDRAAAAMASDAISLARWWRALCAGDIISEASLTEMLPRDDDWYGLGLGDFVQGTVGHFGSDDGGVSLAGCAPDGGIVFVVLGNRSGSVIQQYTVSPLIGAMRRW